MYWSVVSPFKPFGPTLALVFVILVAALKAIAEDKRRHVEDSKLNNSTAHVLNPDGEAWGNTCAACPTRTLHHGRCSQLDDQNCNGNENARHASQRHLPQDSLLTRREGHSMGLQGRC